MVIPVVEIGGFVRLRVLVGVSAVLMVLAPAGGRAEAFASYWSTLSDSEQDFVDHVAAGMYGEERGQRAGSYVSLNSASKARYRARAVEILGVENRPARSNKMGADI